MARSSYDSMIKRGTHASASANTDTGTSYLKTNGKTVSENPEKLAVDAEKATNDIYNDTSAVINANTTDAIKDMQGANTNAQEQLNAEKGLVNPDYKTDFSRSGKGGRTFNDKTFVTTSALARLVDKLNNMAWWDGNAIGQATETYGNTHPASASAGKKDLYGNPISTIESRLNNTNEALYAAQNKLAAGINNTQALSNVNVAENAANKQLNTVEYNSQAKTQMANALASIRANAQVTLVANTSLQENLTEWQTFFKEYAAEKWAQDLKVLMERDPIVAGYMSTFLNTASEDWTTAKIKDYAMQVVNAEVAANPNMTQEAQIQLYNALITGMSMKVSAANIASATNVIQDTAKDTKAARKPYQGDYVNVK